MVWGQVPAALIYLERPAGKELAELGGGRHSLGEQENGAETLWTGRSGAASPVSPDFRVFCILGARAVS